MADVDRITQLENINALARLLVKAIEDEEQARQTYLQTQPSMDGINVKRSKALAEWTKAHKLVLKAAKAFRVRDKA